MQTRTSLIPIDADGKVPVSGTFSADPPVGQATEAKQDALIALLPTALDAGRLKVALPTGGSGLTNTELRASDVGTNPSDRALRDNGKVDVAVLDQYTPVDTDPSAGTENSLPVAVRDVRAWTVAIDYAGGANPIYIGKALPGASKAAAVWQIKKLTYSGSNVTDLQWAGGSLAFGTVWNSRADATYS